MDKEVSIRAVEKISKDPEDPGDPENDWKSGFLEEQLKDDRHAADDSEKLLDV